MRFRCISPKTLLLGLSSSASGGPQPPSKLISVLVASFSTSSSSFGSTGPQTSAGYSSSRNVGVFVWWNFKDCKLPAGTDGSKVAQAITAAIRSCLIEGPITITGFGDVSKLSGINRRALSSTGINLTNIDEEETTVRRALQMNLLAWTIGKPPPAHIFVISTDVILTEVLHDLRQENYNVLVASKGYALSILCGAATIVWDWCLLAKGENVTGWHYNQTPDGSWYGHYKILLHDPSVKRSNSVKTKEIFASNSNLDSEVRPVPERVDKQRAGEKGIDKSEVRGFFNWILKQLKFWGKDAIDAKC